MTSDWVIWLLERCPFLFSTFFLRTIYTESHISKIKIQIHGILFVTKSYATQKKRRQKLFLVFTGLENRCALTNMLELRTDTLLLRRFKRFVCAFFCFLFFWFIWIFSTSNFLAIINLCQVKLNGFESVERLERFFIVICFSLLNSNVFQQ